MFLGILQNQQENTCARVSFLIKLKAWVLMRAILLKKRFWHRYFPVNFPKFLKTPFLQNTSGRLLLPLIGFQIPRKEFRSVGVQNQKQSSRDVLESSWWWTFKKVRAKALESNNLYLQRNLTFCKVANIFLHSYTSKYFSLLSI